jgi:hypothetical protein
VFSCQRYPLRGFDDVLFWCVLAVLVCLTTCGLLRRNGARLREMADSRVLATSRRIHIRRRVAVLRDSSHFRRFRPAGGGEASRAWHLWSSSARCSRSRPHSRSMRRRSRRLRGDTRRNASSADTPPRLAPCLAAHPTNCVVACRSVRHSTPRPFLTFRYGAFLFVASALADLSSARLTAHDNRATNPPREQRANRSLTTVRVVPKC